MCRCSVPWLLAHLSVLLVMFGGVVLSMFVWHLCCGESAWPPGVLQQALLVLALALLLQAHLALLAHNTTLDRLVYSVYAVMMVVMLAGEGALAAHLVLTVNKVLDSRVSGEWEGGNVTSPLAEAGTREIWTYVAPLLKKWGYFNTNTTVRNDHTIMTIQEPLTMSWVGVGGVSALALLQLVGAVLAVLAASCCRARRVPPDHVRDQHATKRTSFEYRQSY